MDTDQVKRAPLFNGMSIKEIDLVLHKTPHRLKNYMAASMIAQSGDLVERLMIVVKGTVKGEMVDYAGRVIKIEDIPAPGALASAFLFGSRNRFPVNVIAISDAEILIIEKEDFLKLLRQNSKILTNFLDMISNRSQFLSEKIKFLNFKTIKGKLAHFILQKAGMGTTEIKLEITQGYLAEFFGVARPSVARALGEMEEEGLLQADGKVIKILNREKLSALTVD